MPTPSAPLPAELEKWLGPVKKLQDLSEVPDADPDLPDLWSTLTFAPSGLPMWWRGSPEQLAQILAKRLPPQPAPAQIVNALHHVHLSANQGDYSQNPT